MQLYNYTMKLCNSKTIQVNADAVVLVRMVLWRWFYKRNAMKSCLGPFLSPVWTYVSHQQWDNEIDTPTFIPFSNGYSSTYTNDTVFYCTAVISFSLSYSLCERRERYTWADIRVGRCVTAETLCSFSSSSSSSSFAVLHLKELNKKSTMKFFKLNQSILIRSLTRVTILFMYIYILTSRRAFKSLRREKAVLYIDARDKSIIVQCLARETFCAAELFSMSACIVDQYSSHIPLSSSRLRSALSNYRYNRSHDERSRLASRDVSSSSLSSSYIIVLTYTLIWHQLGKWHNRISELSLLFVLLLLKFSRYFVRFYRGESVGRGVGSGGDGIRRGRRRTCRKRVSEPRRARCGWTHWGQQSSALDHGFASGLSSSSSSSSFSSSYSSPSSSSPSSSSPSSSSLSSSTSSSSSSSSSSSFSSSPPPPRRRRRLWILYYNTYLRPAYGMYSILHILYSIPHLCEPLSRAPFASPSQFY